MELAAHGTYNFKRAKNILYVAATRARYSVAFVYDGQNTIQGIKQWKHE